MNLPTLEQMTALQQIMRDVPAVENDPWRRTRPPARIELVAMLKDEIIAMRDKGYTVAQIAQFMSEHGFKVKSDHLYSAMNALGFSLSRARQPIARKLRESMQAVGKDKNTAPATPVLNIPEKLQINPKATKILKTINPSDARLFREALDQLVPGSQRVRFNRETSKGARSLVQAGLLRPVPRGGGYIYEVPPDLAHIGKVERGVGALRT
jgi:hypothetical protein